MRGSEGERRDAPEPVAAGALRREDGCDVVPRRRDDRLCAPAAAPERSDRDEECEDDRHEPCALHAKSVPPYPLDVRAELSIEIARTPEEVFAYLTDVANLPKWQSGVHAARREGSRIHESRHMLGRELHTTLEIDEEERPRLFALRTLDSPVPFTVRHELERSGDGTRLTVVGEGDAGMLPGFAAGIMARRAEKQFRKDFERLKRLLES